MSFKGGYQILNLRETPLTAGTAAKIPGIYNQLARSNRKRIVISGTNLGGVVFNDIAADTVAYVTANSAYTVTGGGYSYSVTRADMVTVTPITPAEAG